MSVFDPLFRALSMMSQTISLRIRLLRLVELGRQNDWVSSPASNIESGIDPREEQLLLLELPSQQCGADVGRIRDHPAHRVVQHPVGEVIFDRAATRGETAGNDDAS